MNTKHGVNGGVGEILEDFFSGVKGVDSLVSERLMPDIMSNIVTSPHDHIDVEISGGELQELIKGSHGEIARSQSSPPLSLLRRISWVTVVGTATERFVTVGIRSLKI